MGTIFLVYVDMYVGLSKKNMYAKMRGRNYVAQTHACSKSVSCIYNRLVTPVAFYARKTELQRLKNRGKKAERLRIRHKKDSARRRTKEVQEEKKRSSETEDHEKQCLATLKTLKIGDENEF